MNGLDDLKETMFHMNDGHNLGKECDLGETNALDQMYSQFLQNCSYCHAHRKDSAMEYHNFHQIDKTLEIVRDLDMTVLREATCYLLFDHGIHMGIYPISIWLNG